VPVKELNMQNNAESSETIRTRVIEARDIQTERFKDHSDIYCNAQMNSKLLKEVCVLNATGQTLLKTAMTKLNLSARAYDRILKVSRTIADLAASDAILPEHVAEAITYRNLDREGWGA
jgi:magnesium chelatase family protein